MRRSRTPTPRRASIQPGVRDYDSRDMTPAEQVERMAQGAARAPARHGLGVQPRRPTCSAAWSRRRPASGSAIFSTSACSSRCKMEDTALLVPARTRSRALAQPLATDPRVGPADQADRRVGAAEERFRRRRRRLDRGGLPALRADAAQRRPARRRARAQPHDGRADDVGPSRHARSRRRITPGELLLGTPGYTFGLGFAVRQGAGIAGVPGSAGEFMWAGYAGTYFWVDPKEADRRRST